MQRKPNAEKMLLRLFRVAKILVKAENQHPDEDENADDKLQHIEKDQTEKPGLKHRKLNL